jgi:hypothetical protein
VVLVGLLRVVRQALLALAVPLVQVVLQVLAVLPQQALPLARRVQPVRQSPVSRL